MSLPLEEELNTALYHDLWIVRHAMGTAPQGDDASYVPPSHRYLPILREACAKWAEGQEQARIEIPPDVERDLMMESHRSVNPVHEIAMLAPEMRRYWLVSRMFLLLNATIELLENEGRPMKPAEMLKLVKARAGAFGHGK